MDISVVITKYDDDDKYNDEYDGNNECVEKIIIEFENNPKAIIEDIIVSACMEIVKDED